VVFRRDFEERIKEDFVRRNKEGEKSKGKGGIMDEVID